MRRGILAALFAASATPTVAEAPSLGLPLDCTLGQTCFIEDYMDATPGRGQSDYACGLKSRDGHSGTDFALLDHAAMERGVDVLAAAPGVVDATRDGMPDVPYSALVAEQIKGRECGNAVRVKHAGGYQTLYCHLKRGSLSVARGDVVAMSDPLGQVGMSGQSNYPHVHVTVLKDGQNIDPFNPDGGQSCDATAKGLWQAVLPYAQAGLFTAGFSNAVPSFDQVKSGAARVTDSAAGVPLVLYGHLFYPQKGDVLAFRAAGPDGQIFEHSALVKEDKSQMFQAFGRKAPAGGWPPGLYRGYITLSRDGTVLAARHADVTVR